MKNLSTQIATTREQSERLLAMGVKPETADMHYSEMPTIASMTDEVCKGIKNDETESVLFTDRGFDTSFPAWSLSRLISMMPTNINGYILDIDFENKGVNYSKTNCCDRLEWIYSEGYENLFDGIIDCFGWLIKLHHLNEEYLKGGKP